MMDKMLDDAFVRRGAPLEHTLATLAELTAKWSHPYGVSERLRRRTSREFFRRVPWGNPI
ncbi:hypothetical protein OG497_36545 [Streptomyces sp. NBC_01242]|uniref:hypothetical protein n=2 Tax=Streptomyces TaxID=1883 RepID=UPI003D80A99A|nr:hypothetical protein [Streptomyces sp. NBC_01242]